MIISENKFKALLDSNLKPMPDQFVAVMVFPRDIRKEDDIDVLQSIKNDKDVQYDMYLRVTDENPNQWVVVAVGEDLKGLLQPRDRVYIQHRYYPVPFIHQGVVLHRMCKSDVLTVVDKIEDMDAFNMIQRLRLTHAQVIKPQYERQPLKDAN